MIRGDVHVIILTIIIIIIIIVVLTIIIIIIIIIIIVIIIIIIIIIITRVAHEVRGPACVLAPLEFCPGSADGASATIIRAGSLLGWLETRLAQNTLYYPKIALKTFEKKT